MPDAAHAPCAPAARRDGYARRQPEQTLLYQVVREHWPAFRERAAEQGRLPRFVERDFDEYLRCGILEHGLVHLRCGGCGHAMVVGFSCKRRGFCPSCLGRRMADLAAHLCDDVLPEVVIRQWVCSLPWKLRYPMGFDRRLCADVLGAFIGALERCLKKRAKRELGLRSVRDAHTGALTFVQRSDASLRLNVHFHTLALDGVYVRAQDGALAFHALPEPTAADVAEVASLTHHRLCKVLARHGRCLDEGDDAQDTLAPEQPVLASCYAASAGDLQMLGAQPGARTTKLVRQVRLVQDTPPPPAVAEVSGVNVHAQTAIDGRDRKRLERLCRYIARPPLAQDRLQRHHDGRLRLGFKAPWKDGTHAVLLDPLDFIARLCALVPPPRFHMLRYHGVLSAHHRLRRQVVSSLPHPADPSPPAPAQLPLFEGQAPAPRPTRSPWAWLLRRVFAADVSTCPECGGRMRVLEIATDDADAARVLYELGLGPRPPPAPPAVLPGQLPLPFAS